MKKKKSIVQLHNHMQTSFLDGVGNPEEWIKRCQELDIPGLALTDHGSCCGLMDFYREAHKTNKDGSRVYSNFTPILGEEFYIVTDFDKEVVPPGGTQPIRLNRYHITVLAKNLTGYRNLMRLSSKAHLHFFQRPRIDIKMLFEHSEGLIVTTGCLGSFWGKTLYRGNYKGAFLLAKKFKAHFKEDFYAEVMPILVDCDWDFKKHNFVQLGHNKQTIVNQGIIKIARKLQIKMIPTLDAHYPEKTDKLVQDVLILNSYAGKNGWHFSTDTHYLQTTEETFDFFRKWHPSVTEPMFDEMVENTYEILDKCKDLRINLYEFNMPKYDYSMHRLYAKEDDAFALIKKIIKYYKKIDLSKKNYKDRLKKEISLIKKYDFLDYFLILEDIVFWSRNNGVFVGPGRGSAGGSLLAYAMNITQVDPIKFDCQFERFMNEDRLKGDKNAIPDIDMDFSDAEKVKQYITERFGENNVAAISTVQRMSVSQAITDASRIILPKNNKEFSYWDIKKLTKQLPSPNAQIGNHLKFYKCLKGEHVKTKEDSAYPDPNDKLMDFLLEHKDTQIDRVIERIVGKVRQIGIHPCACVISDRPLTDDIPVMFNKKNNVWVTQYTMGDVEACGLVKFDILSLNTLNYLVDCLKNIKLRHNLDIKLEDVALDDKKTFDAFSRADTDSVFQFNTDGMKSMLLSGGVTSFMDLPAYNALYRPGPLDVGMDKRYILRKHGDEEVSYVHPDLESILQNTLGIILYQEQITEIVHRLGGFSRSEADIIRRMVSKSRGEELVQFESQFLKHATSKLSPVLSLEDASDLWKQIVSFGGYGFNLSHAVEYSLIGYWCQYLKVNYPLEWWASVLKHAKHEEIQYLYKKYNEFIELPEINKSKDEFFITDSGTIAMPINMVYGIGDKATKDIIKNQPYRMFKDLYTINGRAINKSVIINLIFSGSLRDFGEIKDLLLEYYDYRKEELPLDLAHIDRVKMLELQQKSLPVIFYNYHEYFNDFFQEKGAVPIHKALEGLNGHVITTGGKIERIYKFNNRKGDPQAFVTLTNEDSELTLVMFKEALQKYGSIAEEGKIVLTKGRINIYNGKKNLILLELEEFKYG